MSKDSEKWNKVPQGAQEIAQKARDKYKEATRGFNTSRANFGAALVSKEVLKPVSMASLEEYWENVKNTTEEAEATNVFLRGSKRRAERIIALIDQMTEEKKAMTEEKLGLMDEYAKEISELISENPEDYKELIFAFEWVFKVPQKDKMGGELAVRAPDSNKRAKDAVIEGLQTGGEDYSYACLVLALASSNDRSKFVGEYLLEEFEGKKPETEDEIDQAKELLGELNLKGAVSPEEAEALLGEENYSDEEIDKLRAGWTEKHDFAKMAKFLRGTSRGAVNQANEMLGAKNILRMLGYVAGGVTFVTNFFGSWKEIKEDPTLLVTDATFQLAYAEMGASYITGKKETLSELTASKQSRETWAKQEAYDDLSTGLAASPRGWKRFFGTEMEGYKGAVALGEYIKSSYRSDKEDATYVESETSFDGFKGFLEEKIKDNDEPTKNQELLTQLIKIEEDKLVSKSDLSDRFGKFTKAFNTLELTGEDVAGKFHEAIEKSKTKAVA